MLDRRELLRTGALLAGATALPGTVRSAPTTARPDWALGVSDVEADIPAQTLTRLHGRVPEEFGGTLYRNGPARFRLGGTRVGHWFDGHGLVRAWRVQDGSAQLAARFVDTETRRVDSAAGGMVQPGFGTRARPGARIGNSDDINAANTHVIAAGGKLLALWEAGSPHALNPETLATEGPVTFRPDLAHMPFLAHPRIEPDGRIWNLGLAGDRAWVWRLSKDGRMEAGQAVQLPRASYVHDFTATARHLILVLQPWVRESQSLPFLDSLAWRPEQATKVLVLDKDDLTKRRVFDLPALFFFHLGDAWEESDGTIRFDGCFEDEPGFARDAAGPLLDGVNVGTRPALLKLVALHPSGRASMTSAGIPAEFPRSDPALAGLARTQTIHLGGYGGRPFARSVGLWNWRSGKSDAHDFGPRQLVEEFVSAGRWLIGTTLNLDAKVTELHLLDSRRVSDGPVVSWRADIALPLSFHGTWVGR